jgi:P-aminobenzoate N-oxygenase AurF
VTTDAVTTQTVTTDTATTKTAIPDTTSAGPALFERDLLVRLAERWGKRVAVKQDELDLDGHFDPRLPDFPDRLVPPLRLPEAAALSEEARTAMRSASWIAYNAKTAAIENEVILPACRLMLEEDLPVRRDHTAVTALHQTIIDEHYHILMCHNAAGVTRRRRDLEDLDFRPSGWSVVQRLQEAKLGRDGIARDLVSVAFALAAETTINAFLSALSTEASIQPMNRLTVDLHRRDESGHAVIFRELVGALYRELDAEQRELFRESLVAGLDGFRAPDFEPWVAVAGRGGLVVSAGQLADAAPRPAPRDTGPLQLLLADLGLTDELGERLGIEREAAPGDPG